MSNPKKKAIMATGKELFWKHGFRRVTVEEISSRAGVSKMTYYKFFSNKMELAKAVMDITMEEAIARYREIMESDIPFTEKVEKQVEMKMEGTLELSKEFVDDLMVHGEPELMEHMQKMTQQVLGMVYTDYTRAQQRGEIREDVKPEFIIYFLNHIYEMLKDEQLLEMYGTANELAMELIRFFFYGIVKRDGTK
jgi:AcrR family transcriptional regulator